MDAELLLELDHQVEDGAVAVGGVGDQAGELPEVRLLLARGRAERRRVDRPDPLGEDPEAAAAEDLAGVVADLLAGPGSARRRCGRPRTRRRGRARGCGRPARTSSAQILRGMSTSRPQPSPSPSTLPARWSIFCSDSSARSTGSWLGVASLRTEA